MNWLFVLLVVAFSQTKDIVGYLSINDKLLSNILDNPVEGANIKIGINEVFAISIATSTPLRWFLYTPDEYPYVICRQNILDKNFETNEVLQLFGCKMLYQGKSYITISLGTTDVRVQPKRNIVARIEISSSLGDVGPSLTRLVPKTVPTIPLLSEFSNMDGMDTDSTGTYKYPKTIYNYPDDIKDYTPDTYKFPSNPQNGFNNYGQDTDYDNILRNFYNRMMDQFGGNDYMNNEYWNPPVYHRRSDGRRLGPN